MGLLLYLIYSAENCNDEVMYESVTMKLILLCIEYVIH